MRALASSLGLLTLAVTASVAHAEPPGLTPIAPLPTPAAPPADTHDASSYRMQVALADASVLGIGLLSSSSSSSNGVGPGLAIATYALAAPIVHLAHHHSDRAAESLALRVVLPIVGAVIGNGLGKRACDQYCDNDSDLAGTAFGILGGAAAASVIDVAYLSRGEETTRPAPGWSPQLGVAPGGGVRVGLGGSF